VTPGPDDPPDDRLQTPRNGRSLHDSRSEIGNRQVTPKDEDFGRILGGCFQTLIESSLKFMCFQHSDIDTSRYLSDTYNRRDDDDRSSEPHENQNRIGKRLRLTDRDGKTLGHTGNRVQRGEPNPGNRAERRKVEEHAPNDRGRTTTNYGSVGSLIECTGGPKEPSWRKRPEHGRPLPESVRAFWQGAVAGTVGKQTEPCIALVAVENFSDFRTGRVGHVLCLCGSMSLHDSQGELSPLPLPLTKTFGRRGARHPPAWTMKEYPP